VGVSLNISKWHLWKEKAPGKPTQYKLEIIPLSLKREFRSEFLGNRVEERSWHE
jgi:hypothetical protein